MVFCFKITHQILASSPTIYRDSWDFYMVFKSKKYYNMFFRKGKWKSIDVNKE